MKVNRQVIALGRSVGVENIGQVKQFVRGLLGQGKGKMRLVYNNNGVENFVKTLENTVPSEARALQTAPSPSEAMNIAKKHFPSLYAAGNRSTIEVLAERAGNGAGAIKAQGETVSETGQLLARAKTAVAVTENNEMAIKMLSRAKGIVARLKALISFKDVEQQSGLDIMRNIQYSSKDGIGILKLSQTQTKGITAEGKVAAPTAYLDALVESFSQGKFKTLGELINIISHV